MPNPFTEITALAARMGQEPPDSTFHATFEARMQEVMQRHGLTKEVVTTLPNGIKRVQIRSPRGKVVVEYYEPTTVQAPKAGRPSTLPGIIGALASPKPHGAGLGVAGVSEALGTNPRTLNNWARNITPMPAIEAGLLADLCTEHGVTPTVYQHPGVANGYVASTPAGWVMWTWGIGAYRRRTRYRGHLEGLVGPSAEITIQARAHGWPY